MIKVLHFIPHTFMCRVHASFKDDDRFTHYFIMPNYKPRRELTFLETGDQVIHSKHKYYVNPSNQSRSIDKNLSRREIKRIMDFIDGIDPHLIILSDPNLAPVSLFEKLKSKAPVYFINHGTYNQDDMKKFKAADTMNKHHIWSKYDGIISTNKEYNCYARNKKWVEEGRIHLVNGLTQIDYLMEVWPKLAEYKKKVYQQINPATGQFRIGPVKEGDGIPLEKKSILFVQNKHVHYDKGMQLDEFQKIMTTLVKYIKKHGMHLFLKIKHVGYIRQINNSNRVLVNLTNDPNITVLDAKSDSHLYLYHFMFSDVMVVENYGTSLQEGLSFKPEVIRCQLLKRDDVPFMNEFDLLPQAMSCASLVEWLDKFFFHHDETVTPEYEEQRKRYSESLFGKIERVSEKILEIMAKKHGLIGL